MSEAKRHDLKDFTRQKLETLLVADGKERYRAEQIFRWVHQRDAADFDAMTNLAKAVREQLKRTARISRLEPVASERSEDGTIKYVFQLEDGAKIESVWIPGVDESEKDLEAGDRVTLCISTQAGCAMGCTFCHTGTMK